MILSVYTGTWKIHFYSGNVIHMLVSKQIVVCLNTSLLMDVVILVLNIFFYFQRTVIPYDI